VISPDSIVRPTGDAVSCEVDGQATILNIRTGNYFGLDDVGAAVWRIMSLPRTVAEIVQEITNEYDVEVAQCENDLVSLLSELARHGLVEIGDSV
jgi:hypothetical protein